MAEGQVHQRFENDLHSCHQRTEAGIEGFKQMHVVTTVLNG